MDEQETVVTTVENGEVVKEEVEVVGGEVVAEEVATPEEVVAE